MTALVPLDWSRLAPHRPLKPGDPLHVLRPQGSGGELAAFLLKGGVEVAAVVGPVGSGKSTELAHVASLLQAQFVVVQVPLDRALDMRHVTEDDVFVQVARRIEEVARVNLRVAISPALKQRLDRLGGQSALTPAVQGRDLLLGMMRDIVHGSPQGRLALLVDGLEKCDARTAATVVQALLDVRDDARLVFVAPYSMVVGSGGYELQASGTRYHVVRAVPVRRDQEPDGAEGRRFLCEIVRVRLGIDALSPGFQRVVERAAELSGGVPRSFLQLVRAAGSYAALDEREEPAPADLDAAARDQAESMGRLLEKGDAERLREADGRSEREISSEHRLRLLTHGLLLEYKTSQGVMVHPAPLLQGLLAVEVP